MRKLVALLVATGACAALAATASSATTRTVKVGDNWFVRDTSSSPTVTVTRNTRVRWTWVGDSLHNVVVSRGPVKFRSRRMTSGSYSRTMTRRGTYRIYCDVHGPDDQSMTLRVR